MLPTLTFLHHAREGVYPDSFERFSPSCWLPAFAGMTNGELWIAKF